MNPLEYFPYIVGVGLESATGSNPFFIGLIGLVIFGLILFKLNVSLPTSAFLTVLVFGMLASAYDFKSNITTNSTGPFTMFYLLILVFGGVLIFNFLYRRASQ